MTRPPAHPSRLVEALLEYSRKEDRAALAILRRGLGRAPGAISALAPYVERHVKIEASHWERDAAYLIASLFAAHPRHVDGVSMGEAFRRASQDAGSESMEKRFAAMLDAHPEELHHHLRHAIRILASKDRPLDWHLLLADVKGWGHDSRYVQRAWARAYWGASPELPVQPTAASPSQAPDGPATPASGAGAADDANTAFAAGAIPAGG